MARTIARDHGDKRSHLLKTAARVFAEEGVARASMSLVAREAGMSKGNVYHYYEGKDALLFDILDSYLSSLRDQIVEVPETGDGPDELNALIRVTLRAYDGMDHEHQIQSEGLPLLSKAQQTILKGYQREMVSRFSAALLRINPSLSQGEKNRLRATTMSVFGMLNWFYMWHSDANDAARHDYAELVTALTLGGVKSL